MSIYVKLSAILCIAIGSLSCFVQDHRPTILAKKPICGLTMVAPPRPFTADPMKAITDIHCNWIAIVPFGFTPQGQPMVRHSSNHQWWGESPNGVKETIARAKSAGLKTMLKPQVWSHGWWTGDYNFELESDWRSWERGYSSYILYYAALADTLDVEMFCLGTEFNTAIKKRPKYWTDLIKEIRSVYHGPITYAANWDDFEEIPFWDQLDYIGINAYFPLLDHEKPTFSKLVKAWNQPLESIRKCQKKFDKPIIFTEYGYLSVDGATFNTWELEKKLDELDVNQEVQAVAIDALHTVFADESYWQGGFLWKWYPSMQGHEGYPTKDYTPQGKAAEKVLKRWFSL